jgi:tetratricopeptide (TPR) repeat protein
MERGRKGRALRLTDEALAQFKTRLLERAQAERGKAETTITAQAAYLEISRPTLRNILLQAGNDRAALREAFRRVGLPWRDEYGVPVGNTSPSATSPGSPAPAASDSALVAQPVKPGISRSLRWASAVAAILLVALAPGGWLLLDQIRTPVQASTRLRIEIVDLVERGRAAAEKSDYQEAIRLARRAVAVARDRMLADGLADGLFLWGGVLAAQGNLEEAEAKYAEAVAAWKVLRYQHGLGAVLENLGIVQARLGKTEQARASLEASIAALRKVPDRNGSIAGPARALGSLAAIERDYRTARHWYDVSRRELIRYPDPGSDRCLRSLEALLMRDQGRHKEALAELERCLREWEQAAHRRWVAATLLQIGSVHRLAGDREKADASHRRAAQIYRRIGDRRGLEIAREALAMNAAEPIPAHHMIEQYL